MQEAVDNLITWSQLNRLNVSSKKTKEMVLGSLHKDSVDCVPRHQTAVCPAYSSTSISCHKINPCNALPLAHCAVHRFGHSMC